MAEAEMQRRKSAHRQADDMRLVDLQMVQHRPDVIRRARLRIFPNVLRHIGWRITARIVRDRSMPLTEMPHLRLPAAIVAGVFMHEDHRPTGARFFVIQSNPIIRRCVWHRYLPSLPVPADPRR